MTLTQLIQQVTDELGLPRTSPIIGTVDPQTRQFLALLSRLGADIVKQFEWQRLIKEHILTTVAINTTGTTVEGSAVITAIPDTSAMSTQFGLMGVGITPFAQIFSVDSATQVTINMPATASGTVDIEFSQTLYDLPSDWDREISQTEWDRTNRWPLMGPQSSQSWQSFKSGIVYAGPRQRFRILANAYAINPPPPDGLIFAMEYMSNAWIVSPAGVALTAFASDSDTTVFNDSLLIAGLKAKWKSAKGLDASFDLSEFRTLLEQNKAQDKSAAVLSLGGPSQSILLSTANLPDGSWDA
jgi:hypothetical protein